MSYAKEIEEAQRVYKDILNGYSVITFGQKPIYVKHLADIDHGWIQDYRSQIYGEAKDKGVLSEEEKVDTLIQQEIWSQSNEDKIKELTEELDNLKVTLSKLVLKSQKKEIRKPIAKCEKELEELTQERVDLIGITCENYSDKKVSEKYLQYTLFKDKGFENHFLTQEEFEDIDDESLQALVVMNNIKLSSFSYKEIKKITVCPFFLNSLMICKNDPMVFFGKPVIQLSNYQIELFSTGLRFKGVIESKGKTPPSCNSLEEVVNWYEGMLDGDRVKTKGDAAGQTVFGASKEELKAITEANSNEDKRASITLDKAAEKLQKESGKKELDMIDLLKIHGEI